MTAAAARPATSPAQAPRLTASPDPPRAYVQTTTVKQLRCLQERTALQGASWVVEEPSREGEGTRAGGGSRGEPGFPSRVVKWPPCPLRSRPRISPTFGGSTMRG